MGHHGLDKGLLPEIMRKSLSLNVERVLALELHKTFRVQLGKVSVLQL